MSLFDTFTDSPGVIDGLTNGVGYRSRIKAVGPGGESAFSAWSDPFTPVAPTSSALLVGKTTAEIMALPTSGAGWTNVTTQAAKPIVVNLSDAAGGGIASKAASHAVAAGLRFVREGDTQYRDKVVAACEEVRTWVDPYFSAVYRQMAGWVMAAELVGHRTTAWETFVDTIRTQPLTGNTRFGGGGMYRIGWDGPNNHGCHARGAYLACSAFLGDTAAIAEAKTWVQCWLGDPSEWPTWPYGTTPNQVKPGGMSPTDHAYTESWCFDPDNWTGLNPTSAMAGATVPPQMEGAVVMDIERDATFYTVVDGKPVWGPDGEQYSWGAMIGTMTAMLVLEHNGYPDVWTWSDNAGVRWLNYLKRYGSTYNHTHGGWVAHFLNKKYTLTERANTTFTGTIDDSYGYGFTDWLMP